jgi:hypothetical protein
MPQEIDEYFPCLWKIGVVSALVDCQRGLFLCIGIRKEAARNAAASKL